MFNYFKLNEFGIKNLNKILIVTKDDKVFAFGSNNNRFLGLGHNNQIKQLTIVKELCNKGTIDILKSSNS